MDFKTNNMKKIMIFIVMLLGINTVNSQNNLIFNKVITQNLSAGILTVPEGKVWKITAAGYTFKIDGGNNIDTARMPFWINEGSTIATVSSAANINSVSILEFNVVAISSSSGGSSGGLSAEGLEFNKVINYQANEYATDLYGGPIGSIEIPEGKVWKITRVTVTYASNTYPLKTEDVSAVGLYLGDILIFYRPFTTGYSTSSYDSYPVWINSGTKELVIGRESANEGTQYRVTISAIEYNIPE